VVEPQRSPPFALAIEWVAKITTVSLEMVLPAVAGNFLDRRWGTQYWTIVGLVLGMTGVLWHLLQMTRTGRNRGAGRDEAGRDEARKE
jgi:hypothetical protein